MARTNLDAGRLRHRISICEYVTEPDSLGRDKLVLREKASCRAEIKPVRGNEYLTYYKDTNSLIYKITIRYRKGIVPSDVIKFRGRKFEITSVINPDEVNHYLEIMCTETLNSDIEEGKENGL